MRSFSPLLSMARAAVALVTGLAGATPAALDPAGAARLEALHRDPASAGTLIYRGSVFGSGQAAPLFSYERRVAFGGGGMAAAHITRDPDGDVVIAEEARFDAGYALQRFDAANRQLGYSGSAVVAVTNDGGRRLDYRVVQGGRVKTASEEVSDPVVAGPSLHGFILRHWEALASGRSVRVRLIVLAKMQTYAFEIRRLGEPDGRISFAVAPANWLVRLAVAPLAVTFDAETRNVVRYEGRVPPMQQRDGRLETLDARVDYTMAVPAYR